MSFYMVAKFLTGLVLHLNGARVIGKENIPQDKSLVVISNHTSFGDRRLFPMPLSGRLPTSPKKSLRRIFLPSYYLALAG